MRHPLLQLASDREVRQASEFREAAEGLTGEALAVRYQGEVTGAPRRREAGLEFLVPYNKRLGTSRRKNRDEEHLAVALLEHCRKSGSGLVLPDGGTFQPIACNVPLATAAPDKSLGDDDPNRGVDALHLLGSVDGDRMAIAQLKFVAPKATRPGVGETPLRLLLTGLAHTAMAWANRAELSSEAEAAGHPAFGERHPMLLLVASPQYWKLCRKREPQRGAAWIKEHERLATEIEEELGITVRFLRIELQGDPGWSYAEKWPALDAAPDLQPAWERGAGKVRPKPRPKPAPEPEPVVEADPTRPPRTYALSETFQAGDRIEHATLGTGVVQGDAGPGKIYVLFGDHKALLVHGRKSRS